MKKQKLFGRQISPDSEPQSRELGAEGGYLHVPAVGLDVGVGPDEEVVDGEQDGQEGHGEDVDGDGEEPADLLLVV